MKLLIIHSAEASSYCLLISHVCLNRSEAMRATLRAERGNSALGQSSAEGQVYNSATYCLATLTRKVKVMCVVTVENILLMDI